MERAKYDLIVIGSGPAGEKGAAKAAYFGKKVALVEQAPSYGGAVANTGVPGKAMRETALYLSGFQKRDLHGLNVEFHMPDFVERVDATSRLTLQLRSGKQLEPEALLVALGRRSNVAALRLENAGVRLDEHGQLLVNEHFQTNVPHIYAAGDVIGGHALASTAMEEARMAMDHAFPFGGRFRLNDITTGLNSMSGVGAFLAIGIWTILEISMVGETEQGLLAKGVAHTVGRWRYDANPRGMLIAEHWGLLKLLFSLPDEKLRGVHGIGDNACELIAAGLVAMTLGATCSTLIDTCFNYPSLSDLYKYAAYDAMGRIDRGDVYRPWAPARPPLYPQKISSGNSSDTT